MREKELEKIRESVKRELMLLNEKYAFADKASNGISFIAISFIVGLYFMFILNDLAFNMGKICSILSSKRSNNKVGPMRSSDIFYRTGRLRRRNNENKGNKNMSRSTKQIFDSKNKIQFLEPEENLIRKQIFQINYEISLQRETLNMININNKVSNSSWN